MKIALFLILCLSLGAADPKQFLDQVDTARAEATAKEKTAREKLIAGLQKELKTAQSAGKLELVLDVQNRIAELDGLQGNPFERQDTKIESTPINNSAAEKAYLVDLSAAMSAAAKKIESIALDLERKKVAATKAGKIDDALAYEGVLVEVKSELSKYKKELPKQEESKLQFAIDGSPLAEVSIREEMGYVIATLEDGALSHHNLSNKFAAIPPELKGKQYTQQTSNRTSPLKITFETNGSVYILANSSWGGYSSEAKLLAKFAKKTSIKPISNGPEKYEVWIAVASKGTVIETSNHTIISSLVRK